MTWYLLTLIGLLVVTNGLFVYQLFKLVELDAAVRGMKHPKFWGVLAAGSQRGEGLILYLLNRNKAVFSMTEEEKEQHSKNGGLHVDSKWYQEEEYQTVIENAWRKDNGKSYRFTQEDARRAEAFVDAHGIGNSQDENALMRFANEFLK